MDYDVPFVHGDVVMCGCEVKCFVDSPIKPLKSEAIHETGLSGKRSCVLFPLKIFIPLYFNVLSTVPRENRLADSLYIYIYISILVIMG